MVRHIATGQPKEQALGQSFAEGTGVVLGVEGGLVARRPLPLTQINLLPHLLVESLVHVFNTHFAHRHQHWRVWRQITAHHNVVGAWRRGTILPPEMRRQRLVAGAIEQGQPVPQIVRKLAVVELLTGFTSLLTAKGASQHVRITEKMRIRRAERPLQP